VNTTKRRRTMRSRFAKLGAAVTALAALAIGGSSLATAAPRNAPPAPPAAADVQQGDQTAPDAAGSQSESATEQADSESGPSDGPGGYADTNANADTQQQGEN
jgi:hypothetical protein